jgi:hypothetical protein
MKSDGRVRICTFAILHGNDLALSCFVEAYNLISHTPHFCQTIKKDLNEADKFRKEYDSRLRGIIGKENEWFFADTNSRMDEETGHLEEILYWQVKSALDVKPLFYRREIAKLAECSILLKTALVAHDEAIEMLRQMGFIGLRKDYLRLSKIERRVTRVADFLTGDIDFDRCEGVTLAYNNLINKFFNAGVIDKSVREEEDDNG